MSARCDACNQHPGIRTVLAAGGIETWACAKCLGEEPELMWDDGKVVHACESTPVDPMPRLIWTKCQIDVPANAAFEGYEAVTCPRCIK